MLTRAATMQEREHMDMARIRGHDAHLTSAAPVYPTSPQPSTAAREYVCITLLFQLLDDHSIDRRPFL